MKKAMKVCVTGGDSLASNSELVLNDARLAARVAALLQGASYPFLIIVSMDAYCGSIPKAV